MCYSSTCVLTLLALSWSPLVAGQGLRGFVQKPTAAPVSDSVASEPKQPTPADEIKELKQAAAADMIKPEEPKQPAPIGEVMAEDPKKAEQPEQPASIGDVKAEEPKKAEDPEQPASMGEVKAEEPKKAEEPEQPAPIGEVKAEEPKKAEDPEQPAPIGGVKPEELEQPAPIGDVKAEEPKQPAPAAEIEATTRAPMMRREDPVPTISRFNADGTLLRKEPLPPSRKVLIEVTDSGDVEELLEVSDEEYFKAQEGGGAVEAPGDAAIQWGAPQKEAPTAEEEARDAGVVQEVLPPSKEPQDLKKLLLRSVSTRIS